MYNLYDLYRPEFIYEDTILLWLVLFRTGKQVLLLYYNAYRGIFYYSLLLYTIVSEEDYKFPPVVILIELPSVGGVSAPSVLT